MSTRNKALQQFKESVAYATGYAPDGYHAWDAGGYSTHREELARFWSDVRHFIVHDLAHAESIDTKLAEALTSFDRGETGTRTQLDVRDIQHSESQLTAMNRRLPVGFSVFTPPLEIGEETSSRIRWSACCVHTAHDGSANSPNWARWWMNFRQALQLFKENVVGGMTDAPNKYPTGTPGAGQCTATTS